MTQPRITLLICTHNGERTIQQALEAIAKQDDISRDLFEVLVVDNASTDRTSEIATTTIHQLSLNGRVLLESRPGKTNAFLTGVQAARGELISTIDDDNFIGLSFIRYTLDIFDQHPKVGIVGSKNTISISQTLPHWFSWECGRYACAQPMLENIETQLPNGVVIAQNGALAGAGSTIRAQPLLECIEKEYKFFNNLERGTLIKGGCDDLEVFQLIRSLGYKFAFDPRIKVRHAIKPDRLNLEYLKAHCRSHGGGSPGIDPFLFTYKLEDNKWPFRWTWQWQLLSKVRRYFRFAYAEYVSTDEATRLSHHLHKQECIGAIQRIFAERDNYTQHIRQVATGKWTELRDW